MIKTIWKYIKEAWNNPFGRTQFILLFLEVIFLICVIIFVKDKIVFLFLILLLPISEELRMKYSYEITKLLFPEKVITKK